MEKGSPNGHQQPVSPLKRVLLRNIPELKPELDPVINAIDSWARDSREVLLTCMAAEARRRKRSRVPAVGIPSGLEGVAA